MNNENENCDKCGITMCDSSTIHVGDGVYCTPCWPTTGYWKTPQNFVCGICELPMKECIKTDSNCANADCEDDNMNKNENETKPDCDCPTTSEVIA